MARAKPEPVVKREAPPTQLERLARAMPLGLMVLDSRGRLEAPRHLQYLNRVLLDVAAGRTKRLIISVPPQNGKTTLVSRYFPAWFLGLNPREHVNLASYEATFARTHGREARDVLHRNGRVFGTEIRSDVDGQSDWQTTLGGGMFTTGIGGPLTGRPGNILVDDPVKNQEEARSQAVQERNIDWWKTVALTRMRPWHWAIIVMTRWSKGDLVGRILEEDTTHEWRVVNLPAIAEDNDLLGRVKGEALWPEHFPIDYLSRIRAQQGGIWFSAMYQGNPVPDEGALFRRAWMRYYSFDPVTDVFTLHDGARERHFPKDQCQVVSMMDPAATEGEQSAYTALGTWAVTPEADMLLLEIVREKVQTTRHRALIDGVRARWSPSIIGVEKGAYGFHVIQSLTALGYPLKAMRADKDKVARAMIAQARYELGKVYHPRAGPEWLPAYETELLDFPLGTYKDQVDITAYMASYVAFGVAASGGEPIDIGGFYTGRYVDEGEHDE